MPEIDWYERIEAIKRFLDSALMEATHEGDEVKAIAYLVITRDRLDKLIKEIIG